MKIVLAFVIAFQVSTLGTPARAAVSESMLSRAERLYSEAARGSSRAAQMPTLDELRILAAKNRIQTADLVIYGLACVARGAIIGTCALIYACAKGKIDCSDGGGGLSDPGNPASPLSPANPANPASPLNPLNM